MTSCQVWLARHGSEEWKRTPPKFRRKEGRRQSVCAGCRVEDSGLREAEGGREAHDALRFTHYARLQRGRLIAYGSRQTAGRQPKATSLKPQAQVSDSSRLTAGGRRTTPYALRIASDQAQVGRSHRTPKPRPTGWKERWRKYERRSAKVEPMGSANGEGGTPA